MWLHAKFALTLSADTLLVECQLHLISCGQFWQISLLSVFTALVASNTGLIYCLQGYLGERAEQSVDTPIGS